MFARGRLIYPVFVTLRRLDPDATALVSGYDNVAGETKLTPTPDGLGQSARVNKTDFELPCQVEERNWFEEQNQMKQGDAPRTMIHLTFHVSDLKRVGLWTESAQFGGRPDLRVNDQVIKFRDRWNQLLWQTPENPGMFIQEVQPTGFLSTQNLVVCVVVDRSKGSL